MPRDSATDGGYASKLNAEYAQSKGIVNIVQQNCRQLKKYCEQQKHGDTIEEMAQWNRGCDLQLQAGLKYVSLQLERRITF